MPLLLSHLKQTQALMSLMLSIQNISKQDTGLKSVPVSDFGTFPSVFVLLASPGKLVSIVRIGVKEDISF